jgi:hypothetical protein
MTDPKRSAKALAPQQSQSYIREHLADGINVPPFSSAAGLVAAVPAIPEFLEQWIARHFSLSVRLHDVRRELATAERDEKTAEVEAIVVDLDVVQGVLLELHDYAESDARVRELMDTTHVVQHGVVTVYQWLGEILDALPTRSVARRRPSFVDEGHAAPAIAMLHTLERLHPDLERLVRADDVPADHDVASKLAICFRQIGAAIVRISGRATTHPPSWREDDAAR